MASLKTAISIVILSVLVHAQTKNNTKQAYNVYWGDIHCHTAYSDCPASTVSTIPPAGALLYARDTARLDFVAITDHAENLTDSEWADMRAQNNLFYRPGSFVTFHAWEYTKTGAVSGGGHKNVYFGDDIVPPVPLGYHNAQSVTTLWDSLSKYNSITIPHHPAKGANGHIPGSSMSTDWEYVNASLQPIVEVYQSQGNSEIEGCEESVNDFQKSKSVESALKRWLLNHNPAYKLGILCSTDDHSSRPGSIQELRDNVDTSEGYSTGGLIAVMAEEKTRSSIWNAIKSKRIYGTSGPRIGLDYAIEIDSSRFNMGETIANPFYVPLKIKVSATGDGEIIEKIVIIKNGDVLLEQNGSSAEITDTPNKWSYYRIKVFQKATPKWDGTTAQERAWSSPIWFETAPPNLKLPANNSTNQLTGINLEWNKVYGANSYCLQVSTDSLFTTYIYNDSSLTTTSKSVSALNYLTKYYWRINAKGAAGTSSFSSFWSFTTGKQKYSISGQAIYDNSANSPLNNVTVSLKNGEITIDSVTTDSAGGFIFNNLDNGNYTLSASCKIPWSGTNSTDALQIRRHVAEIALLTGLKLNAADVNASSAINSTDALFVRRRVTGIDSTFKAGDWYFENPAITVNNMNAIQNIKGICIGDVNGSYTPITAKTPVTVELETENKKDK